MEPTHARAATGGGGTGGTSRRLAIVGALLAAVAAVALYRASASTAETACASDPPGVAVPEHRSRSLELHVDGWGCVLIKGGAEVTTVDLGWWPNDTPALWGQLEDPAG